MNLIEEQNGDQIMELDLELIELQKTIEEMEENERNLKRKENEYKKINKIKINYGLKETKYDYKKIKEFEKKINKKKKLKPKIGIDKNWEIANMKDPDMNFFFKSKKKYNFDLKNDFRDIINENEIIFNEEEKNIFDNNILDSYMQNYYKKFDK